MDDLKDIILVNPLHLKMVSSGYGEFPDSYKLTEKGIKLIKESVFRNIKGELELTDSPREYSDDMVLASIQALINS